MTAARLAISMEFWGELCYHVQLGVKTVSCVSQDRPHHEVNCHC